VLLVVAVFFTLAVDGSPAFADSVGCELAAAAGYHHPGLNLWCFYDIMIDLWASGYEMRQYYE